MGRAMATRPMGAFLLLIGIFQVNGAVLSNQQRKRAVDSLGGGNLLKRDLDSLGGGHLLRRDVDGLGGGHLLGRDVDSLGGGHLLGRDVNSLGGGHLLRRDMDNLGGGHLLRQLDTLGGGNLLYYKIPKTKLLEIISTLASSLDGERSRGKSPYAKVGGF